MIIPDLDTKYTDYTAEQLLQDDFFISSFQNPSAKSDAFWKDAQDKGVIDKHEFELARFFISSVQIAPERMSQSEVAKLWEDIEIINKTNLKKRLSRNRIVSLSVAAASLALIVSFPFLWKNNLERQHTAENRIENVKAPEIAPTEVQLMLSEVESIPLKGDNVKIAYDGDSISVNEEGIAPNASTNECVTFNQLVVPYGKRSMLTFNDGTQVWVNAGSRVVYPTMFNKKNREIYVDGEIFLNVTRDENCPFVVKTKKMDVEVLGTSFNITAYEKESMQRIVLVSGKVKVYDEERKTAELKPSEMYLCDKGQSHIETVNVDDYISWKSGVYKYESESLSLILKRLSRYYNQTIDCEADISSLRCSGKLDMKEKLEQVLKGISKTAPVSFIYKDGKYFIFTTKKETPIK